MRFDQPRRNPDVGLNKSPVNPHDRSASFRPAEIDVRRVVPRKVVLDSDRVEHRRIADQFGEFLTLVRSVKTRRDQHSDPGRWNAGGEKSLNHRPKKKMIRHRPSDIANGDARRTGSSCDLDKRSCSDRLIESARDCGVRIGQ